MLVKVKNKDGIFEEYKISKSVHTLEDLCKLVYGDEHRKYFGARVENRIQNLHKKVKNNTEIEFIDMTNVDGYRIMMRTISAIFIKACHNLYPERVVKIQHSLGNGLYTSFEGDYSINYKDIPKIKKEMDRIIKKDYKIVRKEHTIEEAIDIFKEEGSEHKVKLFKTLEREVTDIYKIGDFIDTYHGYLAPSTGYIELYDLVYYYPGLIIYFPKRNNPYKMEEYKEERSLARIFDESSRWLEIMNLEYLGSLNEKVLSGEIGETIRVSEALMEKKIIRIADDFCNQEDTNIILIAGPSASGKTTFANRLATHLKVNGKKPVIISSDDYFVNREDTPLKADGSYDFETIDAIDLKALNEDLIKLLEGEEIELPKFNFQTGIREMSGKKITLDKDHPIILEGIHALNPKLTKNIPEKNKYKIYISALTQLNIDAHNRIPTTDTRFIRRLVRDHKYRGNAPERSFELWPSVREGEEKYIFPYQEKADVMVNSALVYELAVLKNYATDLLKEIDSSSKYHSEAVKLLRFLDYFRSIEEENLVPPNSILREFIGGADKNVH